MIYICTVGYSFIFGLTETITDTMEYAIATRVGPAERSPQKKLVMCLCKLPLASLGTDCRQRNTYMTRERTKLFVSGRPFSFMFARGDWTWPRYVRALE